MSLTNHEIAEIFETMADLLEIKGEVIHRILSYRRAAETIRELPRDLRAIADEDTLTDLPNIGKILAEKIREMIETGQLQALEKLKSEIPQGVVEMKRINGVGPKKAKLFWQELGITSVDELTAAAKAGKLAALKGMGKKSEQRILEGIDALARRTVRTPLYMALPAAQSILERLMQLPQSIEGAIAGSIRRARPTIGDVDLLIAVNQAGDSEPIMATFVTLPEVARVLGHGDTKSSIELHNGLQVDLRVLEKRHWGTALSYFTGGQAHNVRVRQRALQQGLSLNEWAFSPVDDDGIIVENAAKITCETEEAVYATLGLPWIPPEIREDTGEIEAATNNRLPQLVNINDIRADLHMHTNWSDGKRSIHEMAEEARARGRQYIVITDHSQYSSIANGLTPERLLEQREEVRAVNDTMGPDFHVFHGVEMDIRADGTLDYDDELLSRLDFVIASLHYGLRQDRDTITKRLLNAIENPHVDLIGHPRGQLIPERDPADLDMDRVFEAAAQHDTALEINANPHRLDLEAQYARRAAALGIRLAINTDAHTADQMDLLHYGIMTARRGWVTPEAVINTWPVERFIEWTNRHK